VTILKAIIDVPAMMDIANLTNSLARILMSVLKALTIVMIFMEAA